MISSTITVLVNCNNDDELTALNDKIKELDHVSLSIIMYKEEIHD